MSMAKSSTSKGGKGGKGGRKGGKPRRQAKKPKGGPRTRSGDAGTKGSGSAG
jgi:hypothetical protein